MIGEIEFGFSGGVGGEDDPPPAQPLIIYDLIVPYRVPLRLRVWSAGKVDLSHRRTRTNIAGRLVVAMATNVSRTDQKEMAWKSCTSCFPELGQQLRFHLGPLLVPI